MPAPRPRSRRRSGPRPPGVRRLGAGRLGSGRLRTGRPGVRRLAGLLVVGLAAATLVAFHAALLWQRVVSFTLLEPVVAAKWAASGLLVAALARLWRSGVPLLHGRRALVLWVLVLLLHVSLPVPVASLDAIDPHLLLALPVTGSALLLTLLLAGPTRQAAAGRLGPRPVGRHLGERPARAPSERLAPALFSRPPPG